MNKKSIVILGGMGPQASIYLYKLLIEKSVDNFDAINNDDFPGIIIHSVPVPDFISDNSSQTEALKMLKQRVKLVNDSNASVVAIACNTAHILLPDLQKISKVPFVSMIVETAKQVYKDGRIKIGLMGTPSTIRYGLYQTALSRYGISVVIPAKRQMIILENIIRNILKGKTDTEDSKTLKKIADDLMIQGAEAIILGCTELPLVFPEKYSLPVYNSLEILAKALLEKYYKNPQVSIQIHPKGGHII